MNLGRDHLPLGHILLGDARERLAELTPGSVDCVITSPPYFALRDYGHPEQIGLESDVDGWVRALVAICRQLAHVLKPGGALWLNVGDGYSNHVRQGAPPKGLLLGPQRLALALAEDGWIMRNQIIWAKTNPIPSSVADRFSCGYEVLFLLVRLPEEVDRVDDEVDDAFVVRACAGTPLEEASRRVADDPAVDPQEHAQVSGFERWSANSLTCWFEEPASAFRSFVTLSICRDWKRASK